MAEYVDLDEGEEVGGSNSGSTANVGQDLGKVCGLGVENLTENSGISPIGRIRMNTEIVTSNSVSDQISDISFGGHASSDTVSRDISVQSSDSNLMDYRINFQYHKLLRHELTVKGAQKEAIWFPFIDSGAQRSVMSKALAELLGLHICRDVNFRVIGFDQKPSSSVYGYVKDVQLVVPGTSKLLKFSPIIMQDPRANICGLDVIIPSGGGEIVDLGDSFGARYVFQSEKHGHDLNHRITSGEKIKVRPGEFRDVEINVGQISGNIVVESNKRSNNLALIDGIVNKNTPKIKVFNTSVDKVIEIQKGQNLGYGYSCDISIKKSLGEILDIFEENQRNKFTQDEIDKMIDKKCEHLENKTIRDKLKKLLKENINCFDIGSRSVGKFEKQVSINPQAKTIELRPEKRRTFNPNVADQVNRQLDEFSKLGLIEECKFPLISPANIVAAKRKGSDKVRVCLDYRRLNEELPANFFPLPTKDELLGRFGGTSEDTCLVKIDIASCFHNFELCEEDRYLTAFFTDKGVMQWRRLPFGVQSAPGIVQREISNILSSDKLGLDKETVSQVFIDDLLAKMSSPEKALKDTEILLQTLAKKGLVAKFEKCEFLIRNNCEYMGTFLNCTDEGMKISANTKNIEAIQNIEKPKDQKSLKAF